MPLNCRTNVSLQGPIGRVEAASITSVSQWVAGDAGMFGRDLKSSMGESQNEWMIEAE